jgi:hypothetical protein
MDIIGTENLLKKCHVLIFTQKTRKDKAVPVLLVVTTVVGFNWRAGTA